MKKIIQTQAGLQEVTMTDADITKDAEAGSLEARIE